MSKKTINEIHVRFRGKFPIKSKLTDKDVGFYIKGNSQEMKRIDNQDGSVDLIYVVDILEGEQA